MTEAAPQRVSRVGKKPVEIPNGVNVSIEGKTLRCKGPKGELERTFHQAVELEQKGNLVLVNPVNGSGKAGAQYQGLTRALVSNMLEGVAKGYERSLDLVGVGYRATLQGKELVLNLGLSHQVHHVLPETVNARVETIDVGGTKRPRVHLSSCDKEALGRNAAQIRSYRPPEPYKGKGVRYTGERIREKAGKAGK